MRKSPLTNASYTSLSSIHFITGLIYIYCFLRKHSVCSNLRGSTVLFAPIAG